MLRPAWCWVNVPPVSAGELVEVLTEEGNLLKLFDLFWNEKLPFLVQNSLKNVKILCSVQPELKCSQNVHLKLYRVSQEKA